MAQPSLMTCAGVAALTSVIFSVGVFGWARPEPGRASLWQLSNRGIAVSVHSRHQLALLRRATVDPQSLRLLARRQGISVFIARSTRQGPCFLTSVRGGFGVTACGRTRRPFPSARLPSIDLTSLRAKTGEKYPRIISLVGIAADEVYRITVRFARGPEYSIAVSGNTYIDRHVPQRPVRMIVALDREGEKLISFPLLAPGPPVQTWPASPIG